jgi:hypothetical protein
MTFFRFPHTPHLAWLGAAQPRDDKVLSPTEAREFLSDEVVVEEKLDGANVGFSLDAHGSLRAQNRGSFLSPTASHPQFKPLFRWMQEHGQRLLCALSPDLILFGEWCYAVHSVRYDRLPDWFLSCDVYDRRVERFWSVERRDALAQRLGLAVVPRLAVGHLDIRGIKALLGTSRFCNGPAEGVYARRERGDWLISRAKLVRPEFLQQIDEHWSRKPLAVNAVFARA